MSKKKRAHVSGLGGKPMIEGVLTRNQNKYSIVVRRSDGVLQTVVKDVEANPDKVIKKIPFVRGIFELFESIKLAVESLEYSAEFYGNDSIPETGFDKILSKLFGKHANTIISIIVGIISFVLCLAIIVAFPVLFSKLLERYIINMSLIHILECLASILILLLYMFIFTSLKVVKRMMGFHSALHQCINCVERGRKLNYKNVAASSRIMRSCESNFLYLIVILSAILFMFIRIDYVPLRLLIRLLYIPVAAGIFYEVYLFVKRFDNIFTRILATPGMLLQYITTRKSDDDMVTVAMASLEAVFDWKEFLVESFPDKYSADDFNIVVKHHIEGMDDDLDDDNYFPDSSEFIEKLKAEGYVEEDFTLEAEEQVEEVVDEEYVEGYVEPEYAEEEEEYYVDENGEYFVDEQGEYYIDKNGEHYYVEPENEYYDEEEYSKEDFIEEEYDEDTEEDYAEEDYSEEAEDDYAKEDIIDNESDTIEETEENGNVEETDDNEDSNISIEETDEIKETDGVEAAEDTEETDNVEVAEDIKETDNVEESDDIDENDDRQETDDVEVNTEKNVESEESSDVKEDIATEVVSEDSEDDAQVVVEEDAFEDADDVKSDITGNDNMERTQPIKVDITDDFGFSPEDEEVDENTMQFEPVDESIAGGIKIEGKEDDYDEEDDEDYGRPKFSKDIVSIPMPDRLDNIVEYIPEGGITSRIYNYDEEEPIDDDDDEDIDFDNIIDENGQLTLKDTDAFERKLDEEFDEMFKRLGLDQDDL